MLSPPNKHYFLNYIIAKASAHILSKGFFDDFKI